MSKEWWEDRLTGVQRDQLIAIGSEALPPGLAHEIGSTARPVLLIQRTHTVDGDEWHLTEEAVRFVGDREYERRHPDEDAPPVSHTVYSMTPASPADVELLYTESCPNWEATAIRLSIALQVTGREHVEVEIRRINTADEAEEEQFTGSPMILFDGVDPFDEPGLAVGLTCRIYRDADGVVRGPTVAQLVDALLAYDR